MSSLSIKAESWQHIHVIKDISGSITTKSTLDIGAGTLNHLPYEPESSEYDIIEPQKELYINSKFLHRVRNIYTDISEIPASRKYDRIVSCNTFEHICNLPEVVARSGLLLKNSGTLRVGIPSEGTFLWSLAWRLTRGIEFKLKYGLTYDVLMKYEHVNTAKEIEKVLNYFFKDIKRKVFGLSRPLSLYQFYACSSIDKDRCLEYLKEINTQRS